MSDAAIIVIGFTLAISAIPDIRTTRWMEGIARRYPSVAIRGYVWAMRMIALAGVGFAFIGMSSTLALMFTDQRTLLPPGGALLILLGIALIMKVPGFWIRDQVRRLEAQAVEAEYHEGPILPEPPE